MVPVSRIWSMVVHAERRGRVEARGRLVQEEHIWLADQGEARIEPAAQTHREVAVAHVGHLVEAHHVEDLVNRTRLGVEARLESDRLPRREVGLGLTLLEHHADPVAPCCVGVLGILAEHGHTAARAAHVALQYLQSGRLACAVPTEEGDDLARLHGETQPSHRVDRAIVHDQVAHLDHHVPPGRAAHRGHAHACPTATSIITSSQMKLEPVADDLDVYNNCPSRTTVAMSRPRHVRRESHGVG